MDRGLWLSDARRGGNDVEAAAIGFRNQPEHPMSVQPPEIPRLSRRTLFVAGSVGMGAMIARPVLAQSTGA